MVKYLVLDGECGGAPIVRQAEGWSNKSWPVARKELDIYTVK